MADPQSKFILLAEDRASATLKRVSTEFSGLGEAAKSAAGLLLGFGGALSLGAIAVQMKHVADLQDEFGKLSQQLGVGVESLTELDYAAKLSDVSTEDLAAGITRLTSKMADVAQGGKEAAAIFESLGVKVKNTDGTLRPAEEVLKDIAQRFSEFEDGSTKTAYAVEIFGRAGAKLIPLLNSGRAGLADMANEARALGIVFDEKAAKAAEEFNDNLTRLSEAARGLKMELLQGLIPQVTEITQRFLDARREGLGFIDAIDVAANLKGLRTVDEQIADVQRRIADARSGKWTGFFGTENLKDLEAQLLKLLKLKDRFLSRETAGTELTIDYSEFGAPQKAPPKLKPATDPAADAAKRREEEMRSLIDAAIQRDFERYQKDVEALDAAISAALDREADRLEKAASAWKDVIDPTREYVRQLQEIRDLVASGDLTKEQGIAAEFEVQDRMQDATVKPGLEKAAKAFGEIDEWTKEAARNIQDELGDNLYDVLDGHFENIGKSFGNMLKRMAAEALAADLARAMFGDFAKTGEVGGWLGEGLKAIGTLIPTHAAGLDYVPYDGYLARLHVGERVQTAAEAAIGRSSGGVEINQTFHFGANVNRAEMAAWAERIRQQTIASIRQANQSGDYAFTGT